MKNFKQLRIWRNGLEIAALSYRLIQSFPKEERYSLSSQLTRAAVSIPSNIAEGSSRSSQKDYRHFIEIALGSCFELETQILIAEAANFGEIILRDKLLNKILDEQKMLTGFISKLNE